MMGFANGRGRSLVAAIWRCRRGTATVEMAFALSFLALLVLGVFDQGSKINRNMQLANAVRAGAQYAMVRKPVQGDLSQIVTAIANTAPYDETGTQQITATMFCECPDGTVVACNGTCIGGDRGAYVRISLQEDYTTLLTYPGLDNPIRLENEATVRLN